MARILLAKARNTKFDIDPLTPPLGVMYLAAVLREAGHEVSIYDSGDTWRPEHFREHLRREGPAIVGLSAITFEGRVMDAMAHQARAALPDATIVVGGPHATAYPEHCARHPAVDFVVVGEGEVTAVALVAAVERGATDYATIDGLVYEGARGELVRTGERASIEDVDALPFPAWDLIDVDFYARRRSMSGMGKRPYMPLFTSRGCPFKCTYCHEVQGKRFRARSPDSVIREMTLLRDRYGIRDFEVIDDIFNFNRPRMIEILDRVIASDLRPALHFPNALRTDLLDAEQIDKLRRAGTASLCIAVETTSERLQKLSKKHLKVDKVRANIDLAVRAGFYTRGFFMLGFPTETYAEARATVEFALRTPLHEAFFHIATPFAGTAMFEVYQEMLRQRGLRELDFDELNFMKKTVNLSVMEDAQLSELQREAYRRFFVNPRRAARILWRHPSARQLFQGALRVLHYALPGSERADGASNPVGAHFDRAGLPTLRPEPAAPAPRRVHLPVQGA